MVTAAGAATPIATIRVYRKPGGAVATVERQGRAAHRYRISLKRYQALREWAACGGHRWKTSGAWMRGSMAVWLWEPTP